MDLFYLGDVLRGLNCSPTLAKIEALGGTKKKGEKFITLEEFYPIYSEMKKALTRNSIFRPKNIPPKVCTVKGIDQRIGHRSEVYKRIAYRFHSVAIKVA